MCYDWMLSCNRLKLNINFYLGKMSNKLTHPTGKCYKKNLSLDYQVFNYIWLCSNHRMSVQICNSLIVKEMSI